MAGKKEGKGVFGGGPLNSTLSLFGHKISFRKKTKKN